MKKEYIIIGAAAIALFIFAKKQTKKIVLTLPQINSANTADLTNWKNALIATPSAFSDASTYLQWVLKELSNRTSSGATSPASVPVNTSSPVIPTTSYPNTGVVNPSTSPTITPTSSLSTSTLPSAGGCISPFPSTKSVWDATTGKFINYTWSTLSCQWVRSY